MKMTHKKLCKQCRPKIVSNNHCGEYFCGRPNCRNYLCDFWTEEYEEMIEDYYNWKMETDTAYYRSDEDEPWFNVPGWTDRKYEKIRRIQESLTSYSGIYMTDLLGSLLRNNELDNEFFHEILSEIREFYRYQISRTDFDDLINERKSQFLSGQDYQRGIYWTILEENM